MKRMYMRRALTLVIVLFTSGVIHSQTAIRLKPWSEHTPGALLARPLKSKNPGGMHVIVEFSGDVSDARLSELRDRGAKILFFLPERGLALSVPAAFDFDDLDVNWKCVLRARDKLSPLLGFDTALRTPGQQSAEADALAPANYIVEFYPDVDMGDARSIALESGARMIENPDLAANHLLVEANARQIAALAEWDEVSYVFPAS